MKVGIIGICGFGRFHAEAFQRAGWRVAAAADRSPDLDDVADRFDAQPYRDYGQMLDGETLDAVSISLPPRLHPEVIRAARARGLAVFCEKPVAPTAHEADELLAELGEDAPVAVGFSFRYHPAYLALREMVRAGELGRIRTVLARKCWSTRTSWRLEKGGGAVFVKDIHYFDLVPWLLDRRPRDLCAFGGSFYHQGAAEDSYQLLMDFPGGATFHLDSAWWTLPIAVSHFEVVGDVARAVVVDEGLRIEGAESRLVPIEGDDMVDAEVRAFARWIEGSGPRPPGLAEAAQANRLAERARGLLQSGGSA